MKRGGFHSSEGIGSRAQCQANPPALQISHRERDPRLQSRSREGRRKLENYSTVIFLTLSLPLTFSLIINWWADVGMGFLWSRFLFELHLKCLSAIFCILLGPTQTEIREREMFPPTVNMVNKTWFKALHSKIQKQYILSDYKLFLSGCHKSQIPPAASCFYYLNCI